MKYHLKNRPSNAVVWPVLAALVMVVIVVVAGIRYWYVDSLKPVDAISENYIRFVIEPGESVSNIASRLQDEGLIKNTTAFTWYIRGESEDTNIQAGVYSLSPSMDVQTLVKTMNLGKTEARLLTVLPGQTLTEVTNTLLDQGGWEVAELAAAFDDRYEHPLLETLPETASLEGYIFPDSYEVNDESTAKDLVIKALDNFKLKIEERNLEPKLEKQGLSLFEAIILASIVEKEAGSDEDKAKIAQVFLKRLDIGMKLGSDVTFFYAAEQMGVPPAVDLDSPYNTRINAGLPPGPIANFNITSLEAVAEPASTDYLYFVAGDNGITYFSKTLAEHEANAAKYCIELCKLQ